MIKNTLKIKIFVQRLVKAQTFAQLSTSVSVPLPTMLPMLQFEKNPDPWNIG